MEVKAKARYIRMSPRKVRLVIDVVRGMNVNEAQKQLQFMKKAAAEPVLKLLNSAVANAEHNCNLKQDNLRIKTIVAENDKRKVKTGRGSAVKVKQKTAKTASITIPGEKKAVKGEILSVEENKANRLFTRRNIITKGATIKVKVAGKEEKAKVTSRPGQHGVVQAVLEK